MKKGLVFIFTLVLILSMVACSKTPEEGTVAAGREAIQVNVKNTYQVKSNGNVQWFVLTQDSFLNEINKRATGKGYKALKVLSKGKSDETKNMLSYDGDTWYIIASKYGGDLDPKEAKNQVYKIQLSLFAEDDTSAKMNGYYLNTLIDMFTPGMADKVTEALFIYKNAPEGTDDVRQDICGNVEYTYVYSKTDTQEFYINPYKIQNTSSDVNMTPIKPE